METRRENDGRRRGKGGSEEERGVWRKREGEGGLGRGWGEGR